ncbi:MAG: YicC/YloC family endoribonuclease [Candidatus Bathyarchaeia archaeon]
MIKSMTGYGQGIAETSKCRAVVDLKTVNNRFLDISLKLPQELSTLEQQVRKRIQGALRRGRVDVTISITQLEESGYEVNLPLIRGYFKALETIRQDLELKTEVDLALVTRLPGCIQMASSGLGEEASGAVLEALDKALHVLAEMRANEGRELCAELERLLAQMESMLPSIEAISTQVIDHYRERLQKRIQDLTHSNLQLDEGRLAQEVAYLAERSDITEEIARLRSHIGQFRQILASGVEAGKKLDFLLQEMNRESNTILAKSNDIDISRTGIELKATIEKMREQVQNVE